MTNKEIKKARKELCEIQKTPFAGSQEPLKALIEKVGAEVPTAGPDSWRDKCIQNIHTALQTDTMINACTAAKWSCLLAAIAAFFSAISAIATLISYYQ